MFQSTGNRVAMYCAPYSSVGWKALISVVGSVGVVYNR